MNPFFLDRLLVKEAGSGERHPRDAAWLGGIPRLDLEFVDMPEELRPQYQSFTCASIERLRAAGYA